MFANLIYLLTALILYATADFAPSETRVPAHALPTGVITALGFWWVCRYLFGRLQRRMTKLPAHQADHLVERLIRRLSITALMVFAIDLYLLRLDHILDGVLLFKKVPTLEALLFLGLFLLYLVMVWASAWPVQKYFLPGRINRRGFVMSNIAFSLPALLPWLLLSVTADMIGLIPYEQPRAFLSSPLGEICHVILFMAAVALWGPVLIQKVWGCRTLSPGLSRRRIEHLLSRGGIRYRDILRWELFGGHMITAGVMGIWGRYRYILVTPAMLRFLTPDEIDAVIAHEMGHVEKHHIHFYLLFFVGYIACVYAVFDPLLFLLLSGPLPLMADRLGAGTDTITALGMSAALIGFFLLYFRYGFGWFMRNFERQADIHVYRYLPDAGAMVRVFQKIAGPAGSSGDKPNWHHFSIRQRIEFLRQCDRDPSVVQGHHLKVRRMMIGYMLLLALVCLVAYHQTFGSGAGRADRRLTEHILSQRIQAEPGNLELALAAGDLYFDLEQFEKAVGLYQRVINLQPDNAHALNNLAWLYATCEKKDLRRPKKALALARRALRLDRSAHVLDTFAEAAYVNGLYPEAIAAAREALDRARERRSYYQGQLKRFESRRP